MLNEKNSSPDKKDYFIGLDIGTDSVGYAVTDEAYILSRHKGEPMWGVCLFDKAKLCNERRGFRTSRRRLERKKMRIQLVRELFASEIAKKDPNFYKKLDESSLWAEDKAFAKDDIDYPYPYDCPTIHHLIIKLMITAENADIRDIYRAAAWLVAHRGHFLNPTEPCDDISKFTDNTTNYKNFIKWFEENGYVKPWDADPEKFCAIMSKNIGVTQKGKELSNYCGVNKKTNKGEPIDTVKLIELLSGRETEISKLLPDDSLEVSGKVCLKSPDKLEEIIPKLDKFGEMLRLAQALFEGAALGRLLLGKKSISEVKVEQYETHNEDLKKLKYLTKKYLSKDDYKNFFIDTEEDKKKEKGYSAYISGNKAPDEFYKSVKDLISKIEAPESADAELAASIKKRMENGSYMPKQVNSDNRLIPYQLYYAELCTILENAKKVFPFLNEIDADGISVSDKIKAIFTFRIPYYVGPIGEGSQYGWIKRKAEGRIYPWNFNEKVDLDESEHEFIKRMTNNCTYLPSEKVLPKCSLLYSSFEVLNEINTIKINGHPIEVEQKQQLYHEVFEKYTKVKYDDIIKFFIANGIIRQDEKESVSGIDKKIKASLRSHRDFSNFIDRGILTSSDVEKIILHITCTTDKARLGKWLKSSYASLSEDDIDIISSYKYKDFGRLSRELLNSIEGVNTISGEVGTVIHFMWTTNDNLMQILESSKYSFKQEIERINRECYADFRSVEEKLDEMGISNAVKRPIYRTLDILSDIVKVQKAPPKKIFVEMTRSNGEKGKRTDSRYKELSTLLKDDKEILKELNSNGDESTVNKKLQRRSLYLYYRQLGKCMYCGKAIDVERLSQDYDIDHIYPRSLIKDDSINNNLVLVCKSENGKKENDLVPEEYRRKMQSMWECYLHKGLINQTKYDRLMRTKPFSNDERLGFINRQLVETSQSTKAVAELLKEYYPNTEIVYVKAENISDFRHEYGSVKKKVSKNVYGIYMSDEEVKNCELVKSRIANDIHHAHDAYLSIVVGNVFYEKFTRSYKSGEKYSLNIDTIFGRSLAGVWEPSKHLDNVDKSLSNKHIHLTKYRLKEKGELFDQQPIKAGASDSLIPRKKGLDTKKYGGYNSSKVSFYLLIRYKKGKKYELSLLPIRLIYVKEFEKNMMAAVERIAKKEIKGNISEISLPFGARIIKKNTVFSFDGFDTCLVGKGGDGKVALRSLETPYYDNETLACIKRIENLNNKLAADKSYQIDEFDGITKDKNLELFETISKKINNKPFSNMPGAKLDLSDKVKDIFSKKSNEEQIKCLTSMISYIKTNRSGGCDMESFGGSKNSGIMDKTCNISSWIKEYKDIRIIDRSSSGLFETRSPNLAKFLSEEKK